MSSSQQSKSKRDKGRSQYWKHQDENVDEKPRKVQKHTPPSNTDSDVQIIETDSDSDIQIIESDDEIQPVAKSTKSKNVNWRRKNIRTSEQKSYDDDLDELQQILQYHLTKEQTLLMEHINKPIHRPKNVTDAQHLVRQYGRMKFHVYDGLYHEKVKHEYYPINIIFPDIFYDFMGEKEKQNKYRENFKSHEHLIHEEKLTQKDQNNAEIFEQYVVEENANDVVITEDEVPQELERHIDNCMDTIYENLSEMSEQYQADFLRTVTGIKRCDENCEEISEETIGAIDTVFRNHFKFGNLSSRQLLAEYDMIVNTPILDYHDESISILQIFINYRCCYQGFRTMTKRIQRILTILKKLVEVEESKISTDIEKKEAATNIDNLPWQYRLEFLNATKCHRDDTELTESFIRKKYKNVINEFETQMKMIETHHCVICDQLRSESVLLKKLGKDIAKYVKGIVNMKSMYRVCRMCWRSISNKKSLNKLPDIAVLNGFDIEECPPILKGLNTLEKAIIQKTRFVAQIFQLRDISGKSTGMLATKGCMTIIPVAVNETIEHVCKTLPDASHMIINVDTEFQKTYLVSMRNVIRALLWLKKHNPHYSDIHINKKFKFEVNKNVFFKKNPTKKEVRRLVKYDYRPTTPESSSMDEQTSSEDENNQSSSTSSSIIGRSTTDSTFTTSQPQSPYSSPSSSSSAATPTTPISSRLRSKQVNTLFMAQPSFANNVTLLNNSTKFKPSTSALSTSLSKKHRSKVNNILQEFKTTFSSLFTKPEKLPPLTQEEIEYLSSLFSSLSLLTPPSQNFNNHYVNAVTVESDEDDEEEETDEEQEEDEEEEEEEDDYHLLDQKFDTQALQPNVMQPVNKDLMWNQYVLRRVKRTPLSIDQKDIDATTFPFLFPSGENGFDHARQKKVQYTKFCRAKLLNKNRVFANTPHWIIFAYTLFMQKCLTSRMGIQARCSSKATGKEIKEMVENDVDFQASMSGLFTKIRGTADYWVQRKLMLRAHCYCFGPPTIFLTLNPNLTSWYDLFDLYKRVYKCEIDETNIRQFIAKDPVLFSRYFNRRVNLLFRLVILKDDGPFGQVIHHFRRIEYQHRGTQHCHCLLWIKDRPSKEAMEKVKQAFVDARMCARKPDEKKEPKLFEIITNHQYHWTKHTKTCLRMVRHKGKISQRCRFSFPRPKLALTTFRNIDKRIYSVPGMSKRSYYLARRKDETMINDYNPTISLIWNGNTDVQYLDESSTDVVNYVTSYTTKYEFGHSTEVEAITSKQEMNKYMMEVFREHLNSRSIGLLEMVDILLSHACCTFDSQHIFVNTNQTRTRILKPIEQLKKNELATNANMVDVYYPQRPKELKAFGYLNICINFEVIDEARLGTNAQIRGKNVSRFLNDTDIHYDDDDMLFEDNEDEDQERENERNGDAERRQWNLPTTSPLRYHYHTNCEESIFYDHPNIQTGQCFKFGKNTGKVFIKRRQMIPRVYIPEYDEYNQNEVDDFYRRWVMKILPWRDEERIVELFEGLSYEDIFNKYMSKLKKRSPEAFEDLQKFMNNITVLKSEEKERKQRLTAIRKAIRETNIEMDVDDQIEVTCHRQN